MFVALVAALLAWPAWDFARAADEAKVPPKRAVDLHGDPLPQGAVTRLGHPLGIGEIRTGSIHFLTYSPDGKLLATCDDFTTVRIWNAATGRPVWCLEGPFDGNLTAAFSPDGKTLAAAGPWVDSIRLWNLDTGKRQGNLTKKDSTCFSLAFSPDGKWLATGDEDRVHLWDVAARKVTATLGNHTGEVGAVAFSRDGKLLATSDECGKVRLWDVAKREIVRTLKGHEYPRTLTFSPDDAVLFSGGGEKMHVWRTVTGELLHTFAGRNSMCSPDGKRVVAQKGKGFQVWNAETGDRLHRVPDNSLVAAVAISPDGKVLTTGGNDRVIRRWDLATGEPIRDPKTRGGSTFEVQFSPKGEILATGNDKSLFLWEAATGRMIRELKGHTGDILSARFAPDGKTLISASKDGTVRIWNTDTGEEIQMISEHKALLKPNPKRDPEIYHADGIALGPDGKTLALSRGDLGVRVWDIATGKDRWAKRDDRLGGMGLAYSLDGALLASSGHDDRVHVWDAATGRLEHLLKLRVSGGVLILAFSPDKKLLAGAGGDGIQVWELESGKTLHHIRPGPWVRALVFSRDNKHLAAGLDGGKLQLWDVATGKKTVTFAGHDYDVQALAFSPDGKTLASGSSDGTALVWSVF
jgi:WD40 repeat protein